MDCCFFKLSQKMSSLQAFELEKSVESHVIEEV